MGKQLQIDNRHPKDLLTLSNDQDLVDAVLDSWCQTYSETTSKAYRIAFKRFCMWYTQGRQVVAIKSIVDIQDGRDMAAILERWAAELEQDGMAPAGVYQKTMAMKSFMNHLYRIRLVDWQTSPRAIKVVGYRDTAGPSKQKVSLLYNYMATDTTVEGLRDFAMFSLMAISGLRNNEIRTLKRVDLHLDENYILITGKGHKDKVKVAVPDTVVKALYRWIHEHDGTHNYVFYGFKGKINPDRPMSNVMPQHILNKHTETLLTDTRWRDTALSLNIQVGDFKPHGLRHAAITTAIDSGMPFVDVQTFARHKRADVTGAYYDNRNNERKTVAVSETLVEAYGAA